MPSVLVSHNFMEVTIIADEIDVIVGKKLLAGGIF